MSRLRTWIHSALDSLRATRLSRRALRTITQQLGLQMGCRVLVAGSEPLELAHYFARLGIRVSAFVQNSQQRTVRVPSNHAITKTFGDAKIAVPYPPHCFDAIVLTDDSVFGRGANEPLSFAATGNLLGCLMPGGCLGLIRNGLSQTRSSGHRAECFTNLFSAFQLKATSVSLEAKRRGRRSSNSSGVLLVVGLERDQAKSRVDWLQSVVQRPVDDRCCPACQAVGRDIGLSPAA